MSFLLIIIIGALAIVILNKTVLPFKMINVTQNNKKKWIVSCRKPETYMPDETFLNVLQKSLVSKTCKYSEK